MNFIKENKVTTAIIVVLLGVFVWWYAGYAEDKSMCEDKVRFNGQTHCIGAYGFGQCESYAKRYETHDMAMKACIKSRRK